jgi:outer membrane biosynthesis protein TonB
VRDGRGMRTGLAISGAGHAAVLLWSVLVLVARPYHADSTQALPIDVISSSEFSQLTNGAKNAPPAERPKPVADKVAEAAPVEDPTAKLAKKEIKAATDVRVPEPKPPEPKAKKQPPAPADPIAEALKKDEDKKPEPKKPDPKPPMPPKKLAQPEPASQFDPRDIKALLDKRTPQRLVSAAEVTDGPLARGSFGHDEQMSQTELDALRGRLAQLWSPPAGAKDPQELTVTLRIKLKPDGTLDGGPVVLTGGNSPLFVAARDSAVRAVYRGQPFTMLKPEHFEQWKEVEITFDPRMMIGG